jgi:hypothetical protein
MNNIAQKQNTYFKYWECVYFQTCINSASDECMFFILYFVCEVHVYLPTFVNVCVHLLLFVFVFQMSVSFFVLCASVNWISTYSVCSLCLDSCSIELHRYTLVFECLCKDCNLTLFACWWKKIYVTLCHYFCFRRLMV